MIASRKEPDNTQMAQDISVQEAMDRFLLQQRQQGNDEHAEAMVEHFIDYLLYYSDLFQDPEEPDDSALAEWEAALEQYMEQLFEGDTEQAPEVGVLPLSQLDGEHLRDFIGWYLLREPSVDSLEITHHVDMVRQWLEFMHARGWLDAERYHVFLNTVNETAEESIRAVKAARLLLHFVRLGAGIPPRLRGRRFSDFVEGHARIVGMDEKAIQLNFDNQERVIGPVMLPEEIRRFLQVGDVLDVELGEREGHWMIVDIGPVYPSSVYVEAEELKLPDKLM